MNSIPSTAQRFGVLKAFFKERKTDREFLNVSIKWFFETCDLSGKRWEMQGIWQIKKNCSGYSNLQ